MGAAEHCVRLSTLGFTLRSDVTGLFHWRTLSLQAFSFGPFKFYTEALSILLRKVEDRLWVFWEQSGKREAQDTQHSVYKLGWNLSICTKISLPSNAPDIPRHSAWPLQKTNLQSFVRVRKEKSCSWAMEGGNLVDSLHLEVECNPASCCQRLLRALHPPHFQRYLSLLEIRCADWVSCSAFFTADLGFSVFKVS